ncbi:YhgE/Pip domain-containing protein [Herbiconiux sp. CPCC 203407]|uniref:YhgE/Pip domain-containing protein n=1 Tax=Herbiconiux oxytropis TaxID=2970915 RepID=A0AA41XHH3_9MICO|nr:YhgE/Pip domain-containing protein [Herbiconiux oxytropis]MCS5723990.1 YhgE/Pip domain-containing protein [Herbiconiux oxytropis]MCS5726568.1 YhgE/Pip domain-containing protein [Herbiconiux oxytropis]
MSTPTSIPTPRSRRRTRIVLVALTALAVVLTPFAVNGLFSGALANADTNLSSVPAAVVNNDEMTTTTNPDGTESVNFAGRAVVTELTGSGETGFDWNVTNSADAEKGLADGTYYAVLTIPKTFSADINTLGTPTPEQSLIHIETDDSHGYLQGVLASTVASAVQAGFGQQITAQVVNGIYTSFGTVGTSLSDAADGASQLATGADGLASGGTQLTDGLTQLSSGAASATTGASELADGLGQLSSGATDAANGATQLSVGVTQYTTGVDELATGLGTLRDQTTGLGQLSTGIADYTGGVSQTAAAAQQLSDGAALDPRIPEEYVTALGQLSSGLQELAAGGTVLTSEVAGLPELEGGIADAANGAARISTGSADISSGVSGLADGVSQLASGLSQTAPGATQLADGVGQLSTGLAQTVPGAQQIASGAGQLGDGATTLADGLSTGADQLSANVSDDPEAASKVIAQPVTVDVTSQNQVGEIGQVVSTLLLPVALWLGALALFLWLRPFSAGVLASSVSTGRLTLRTFGRAAVFAALQVVPIVAFLHLALGVEWSLLPATLGFSLVVGLAFTAFHQLLATAFGRIGAIVSLVLLALQLASTGGLYPIEILSGPFQAISAISPLSYAVSGIQAIFTGGSGGTVVTALLVMAVLLLVSLLLSAAALRRRRRPVEIGWVVPAPTPVQAPAARRSGPRPQTVVIGSRA